MYGAASQYNSLLTQAGYSISLSWHDIIANYFTPVDIAGISTSPFQYGGLVPLVAIYQINYPAYYAATGHNRHRRHCRLMRIEEAARCFQRFQINIKSGNP